MDDIHLQRRTADEPEAVEPAGLASTIPRLGVAAFPRPLFQHSCKGTIGRKEKAET